jgi:hypothetical protein
MAVSGLIHLLIVLLFLGLIMYVVHWALGQIPLPDPIRVVVLVILALIVLVVLLNLLLPMLGSGPLLR